MVSFAICTVGIVAGASNFFALHPAVAYVLWIVLLVRDYSTTYVFFAILVRNFLKSIESVYGEFQLR